MLSCNSFSTDASCAERSVIMNRTILNLIVLLALVAPVKGTEGR